MKKYLIVYLLFFLIVFESFSQNKVVEKEITKLEIEWHNAYKTKNTGILSRVLADDFIHINRLGNQFNKKAEIDALRTDDAVYDSIYPYAMQFNFLPGSVVVIGKTKEKGIQNGKEFDNDYFWTDIFEKHNNKWQCILAQTAPLQKSRLNIGVNLGYKDSIIVHQTNELLLTLARQDKFSGVVLVAKNKSIIYQGSFGNASKEYNVPVNFTTAFNLASMTKMFTGIAVAQLAEQGKLSFNDAINKYLPELPERLTSGITIHHLLTHTSGLGSFWTDEFHNSNHAAYRTLNDYVTLIKNDTLQFKPGSKWAYSNTGYLILGLIIEKITGLSYFEYVKQNVFEKAGMNNADFYESDIPTPGIATAYTKQNRYINDTSKFSKPIFIAPVKGSPAGGAYASVTDMFNFTSALLDYKLLNKESTKNVLAGKASYGKPEQQKKYAYGFANQIENGNLIIFHDGGANGISTELDIYPELGYSIIVLSNYDNPASWNVVKKIRELITK